jgi:hypothetical protein
VYVTFAKCRARAYKVGAPARKESKRRTAISRIIVLGFHLEGFRFEILIEAKLIKAKLKKSKTYRSKTYNSKTYRSKTYRRKTYRRKTYRSKTYRRKTYRRKTQRRQHLNMEKNAQHRWTRRWPCLGLVCCGAFLNNPKSYRSH